MPNSPVPAAAEGLPNDRLKPLLDAPDFKSMRAFQWAAVYDALEMASDVLLGIQNQPRCGDTSFNAAGEYLDQIVVFLHEELDRLAATIKQITPEDPAEAHVRARLLIRYAAEVYGSSMTEIAALALSFHNERH